MHVGQAIRLREVAAAWELAGLDASLSEGRSRITVSKILVPAAQRGAGLGAKAMGVLLDYADFTGQAVVLSPSVDFGASSVARLQRFYGRFGFVRNAGRHRDFTISDSMYRTPRESGRQRQVEAYPMEAHGRWYGDEDYESRGARLVSIPPSQYLAEVRPLALDEESMENIDLLKDRMIEGGGLDPLALYADGREDGKHRAYAARELGVPAVPVLDFGGRFAAAPDWMGPTQREREGVGR